MQAVFKVIQKWKISLSQSNIDGGSAIMVHSAGMDFSYCHANDDAIEELDLKNCNFTMDVEANSALSKKPLNIYPNPSSGSLTLNYTNQSGGEIEITVLDQLGEVVFQKSKLSGKVGRNLFTIDLSDLPSGFYVANICTSENQVIAFGKFILIQ